MASQLVPISNPAELKQAGLPWETIYQAQWAFRKRNENGLAGAFVRIGRRVYVDPQKALELASRNVA